MPEPWIVDRIEDDALAVVQSPEGMFLDVPLDWLPDGVREGDALVVEARRRRKAVRVYFRLDAATTKVRRDRARRLREDLSRGPEGDIQL